MPEEKSPLPPCQRLITWTNPSGEIEVIDDTVSIHPGNYGVHFGTLFAERDVLPMPTKGGEYARATVDGFIPPSGDNVFAIDVAPNSKGVRHFTSSLDYIVVVKGTVQIGATEGKVYDVHQGGVHITCGNVHQFINPNNEWTREYQPVLIGNPPAPEWKLKRGMIAIVRAAEPYKSSEGKGLKELYPDATPT